uniref:Ovule protein n=1 Tax=Heterorhabditis bacteriophora TaxID=37862 RepID=A0A1I7XQP3_HETBA
MNQHRSGVIPHQQSMQQMSFTNNTSPVQQVNQVLPNHSVEGIVHHQQGFGMTQHSNHSVSSVSNNNKMAVQQSQGCGVR